MSSLLEETKYVSCQRFHADSTSSVMTDSTRRVPTICLVDAFSPHNAGGEIQPTLRQRI